MNWPILIEVLIAVGFFELIRAGIRRFRDSKAVNAQATSVIQGMSLALLDPLHKELDKAQKRIVEMGEEIDAWVQWSHKARRVLEDNNLTFDPLPPSRYR